MPKSSLVGMLLAGALAVAGQPALAQPEPTADEAMANVIHAALAPESYGDWAYDWDAVSARISRLMHWHMPGPDKPDADEIVRRGWISTAGMQISVKASGKGEAVTSLSFEINQRPRGRDDTSDLMGALSARGVAVAETERSAPPDFLNSDAPIIVYALSAAGRDNATLTRVQSCTSPMSAAAQRCTTTYEVAFDVD